MIKFNDLGKQWQDIEKEALEKLKNTFVKGDYILGEPVRTFENNFAKYVNAKYAIGVGNGTDAIKIAVASLDLKGTSIFYVPANTYIATLFGILASCTPNITYELIDCDNYHQIDVLKLEERIEKTVNFYDNAVIVPVHLYGNSCDMKAINYLKQEYNCYVIEDCSQAHGTINEYGIHVGSCSDVAAYSLYPGKNLGALGDAGIITTNSEEIYTRILKLRNIGSSEKYHHDIFGWNSRLDTIQAIVLDEKLKKLEKWTEKKNLIAKIYEENLKETLLFKLPKKSPYCERHSYHLYVIRSEVRDAMSKYLIEKDIPCLMHYPITIEDSKALKGKVFNCYNAQSLACKILSLPMHPYLHEIDLEYIIKTINKFNKEYAF